ncbi:MAG: SDR family oxidoreductase [Gammaproteobacteria bacterium]|nr:SDR family oxidoreductase [Gammaproteobacteria bacterium]
MKNFLIVGATSGIGLGLACRLSDEGHGVISMSRRKEGPATAAVAAHWSCDVTDFSSALPDWDGPLDGLVYLPGSITLKPFSRLNNEQIMADLQVNYLGAVRVIQHYLKNLKQAGSAAVVTMSSVAVATGMPYHASISGAKGAVEGLTRALAAELAPAIRVNAVAPSLVDTPLAAPLLSSARKREDMAARHPARSIGDADKVAALIAFLLSDDASWMTGQIVAMDGGMGTLRTAGA